MPTLQVAVRLPKAFLARPEMLSRVHRAKHHATTAPGRRAGRLSKGFSGKQRKYILKKAVSYVNIAIRTHQYNTGEERLWR